MYYNTNRNGKETFEMKTLYFYKAYFKRERPDYIATTFPVRRPKSIDSTCIHVVPISIFHYLIAKVFRFKS